MRSRFWSALAAGLALSAMAGPADAQFIIDHETSGKRLRGLHGPLAPRIKRSFESDREAAATFREILAATGIPGVADRIQVRASAETANAEAQIGEDGQRYIFYNSTFMRELGAKTRQYWALVFVIAHEVGHHIAGHLDFAGQDHRVELEADRYAGFILGRMGATHDEAIAAVGAIGAGAGTSTHPPRDQRVQIVSLGWNDGAGPPPARGEPPPARPSPPIRPPAFAAPQPPPPAPSAAGSPRAAAADPAPRAPRITFDDRAGSRLEGHVMASQATRDPAACRSACIERARCIGYQLGGVPPRSLTCQLFDEVTARALDANWRSGLRDDLADSVPVAAASVAAPPAPAPAPKVSAPAGYAFRVHTRLDGHVISTVPKPDAETCRKSCDETIGCVGYQFGGVPPLTSTCQLFDAVNRRTLDTQWRSGVHSNLALSLPVAHEPGPTQEAAKRAVAARPSQQVLPAAAKSVVAPLRFGYKTRTNALVVGEVIKTGPAEQPLGCLLMCMNTRLCTVASFSPVAGSGSQAAGQGMCTAYSSVVRIEPDRADGETVIFKE
ncbi:MAG: PAN domain-containing protein [Hyphomicrobiaceae bacterium]